MTTVLVGAYHFDPAGPSRLRDLLTAYKPQTLAIESTPRTLQKAVSFHRQLSDPRTYDGLLAQLHEQFPDANAQTLDHMLSTVNYEHTTLHEYAHNHGLPLICASEDDHYSAAPSRQLRGVVRMSLKQLRARAQRYYADPQRAPRKCSDKQLRARNNHTRDVLAESACPVLYVGELGHVFAETAPPLAAHFSKSQLVALSEVDGLRNG